MYQKLKAKNEGHYSPRFDSGCVVSVSDNQVLFITSSQSSRVLSLKGSFDKWHHSLLSSVVLAPLGVRAWCRLPKHRAVWPPAGSLMRRHRRHTHCSLLPTLRLQHSRISAFYDHVKRSGVPCSFLYPYLFLYHLVYLKTFLSPILFPIPFKHFSLVLPAFQILLHPIGGI